MAEIKKLIPDAVINSRPWDISQVGIKTSQSIDRSRIFYFETMNNDRDGYVENSIELLNQVFYRKKQLDASERNLIFFAGEKIFSDGSQKMLIEVGIPTDRSNVRTSCLYSSYNNGARSRSEIFSFSNLSSTDDLFRQSLDGLYDPNDLPKVIDVAKTIEAFVEQFSARCFDQPKLILP